MEWRLRSPTACPGLAELDACGMAETPSVQDPFSRPRGGSPTPSPSPKPPGARGGDGAAPVAAAAVPRAAGLSHAETTVPGRKSRRRGPERPQLLHRRGQGQKPKPRPCDTQVTVGAMFKACGSRVNCEHGGAWPHLYDVCVSGHWPHVIERLPRPCPPGPGTRHPATSL